MLSDHLAYLVSDSVFYRMYTVQFDSVAAPEFSVFPWAHQLPAFAILIVLHAE